MYSWDNNKKNKLKEKLQKKYDIVINFLDYHIIATILGAAILISSTSIAIGVAMANRFQYMDEQLKNSKIEVNDESYNFEDIYIVYSAEDVYFCNRKLIAVNEVKVVRPASDLSTFPESGYEREKVYEYYNIKDGKKVCQTHEPGFYIEQLKNFYTYHDLKKRDFELSINDLETEHTLDEMLEGDPGFRKK